MKWIGQSIADFIARFRSDVYLESIADHGSDPDRFLTIDSSTGKVTYRTGSEVFSDIGAASGDITAVVAGTNLSGGATSGSATLNVDDAFLVNDGSDTTTGTITAGGFTTAGIWTFEETTSGTVGIEAVQDSGTSFDDNDVSLMTAAAIADKIEAYGYSTTAGDITAVVAGTNLSGGATSGSATITLADASDSVKGAASFNVDDFAVSSGAVTLAELTVSHIQVETLVTESEGIASNDNDVTLPTSAAVKDYADAPTSAYHYIHTENKFTNTTADEYYFSLTDVDREDPAGSEAGIANFAIMPATGILKSVIINSQSNLSSLSWTWRFKKSASGTADTGESLVATVTSTAGPAGNTNKVISFVTNTTDTNVISYESGFSATVMFNAGDRVLFSQQSNSDAAGSPKIRATFIFQLNETTCL